MLLKRKHSDADFTVSSSFSTLGNSAFSARDPSQSPTPASRFSHTDTYTYSGNSAPLSNVPRAYLHSRTRKRHRDNRPESETVHGKLRYEHSYVENISLTPSHREHTEQALLRTTHTPARFSCSLLACACLYAVYLTSIIRASAVIIAYLLAVTWTGGVTRSRATAPATIRRLNPTM